MGGLTLDTEAGLRKGGGRGRAVVPGQPDRSLLLQAVAGTHPTLKMPPGGKLAPAEVALLRDWIQAGAVLPSASSERGRAAHWAFQPLQKPVIPRVKNRGWVRNPIDAFILRRLEAKGLTPNAAADRRTLIRRVTFDLTGLPPTPEEVGQFVNDRTSDAYPRLVDRLLASPAYGERWGRHWLDLARYADSDGYEADKDRPEAWPYRDFVIKALNEDLPYRTFIRWQLAGDEYAPDNPAAVAATGFLAAGPYVIPVPSDTEHNKLRYRYDDLDNMLSTTSSAMLGLTVGCARCHDHKYDPIPTRDYYQMLAAFTSTERRVASLVRPQRELDQWVAEEKTRLRNAKIDRLPLSDEEKRLLRLPSFFFFVSQARLYKEYGKQLEVSDAELRDSLSPELVRKLEALEKAAKAAPQPAKGEPAHALILTDTGPAPAASYLLRRGEVDEAKEPVSPGFLQVLEHGRTPAEYLIAAAAPGAATTRRRMALAEWMTDTEHGAGQLLARVIVNRLWQHHFGEGLVRTPGDFGLQGEHPTHPELLDWLAGALIRNGWRLKPLHRLMALSAAYQQGDGLDARRAAIDPENRLWWRRRPLRLEAEVLRDATLAVSGGLNRRMYGPAFRPRIPKEAIATRSGDAYPTDIKDSPDLQCRSVYAFIKRSVNQPLMEVFDAPEATAACSRRVVSTVPTQALALLNDPFIREQAEQFAQRASREAGGDAAARVRRAYLLALGRTPTTAEAERAARFLRQGDARALADFCHVLLTLNEFIYVD